MKKKTIIQIILLAFLFILTQKVTAQNNGGENVPLTV